MGNIFKLRAPLFIVVILVAFTSCRKQEEPEPIEIDFRDKWIGSYMCIITESGREEDTLIVDVIKMQDNSILTFIERDLDSLHVYELGRYIVNKNGEFERHKNRAAYAMFSGYFVKDSIYARYLAYSPNFSMVMDYKGKKIRK